MVISPGLGGVIEDQEPIDDGLIANRYPTKKLHRPQKERQGIVIVGSTEKSAVGGSLRENGWD
jgi:hypothetical protein